MKHVLDHIHGSALPATATGTVASYIPALAKADPSLLGIAVVTADGEVFSTGAAETRFTMQSISKVLALAYVTDRMRRRGCLLPGRAGAKRRSLQFHDPPGNQRCHKPFNPFINAGAIVVSGLMPGSTPEDKGARFRAFVGQLIGRDDVARDEEVYISEKATAARNRSIAWFLKELGILPGEVEETLDVYFRQCAVSVDALDLARIGAILCTDGMDPTRGVRLLAARTTRVIKSLMVTCGLYDGSGEFAVDVGIPAKSGVGGGIMASVRDRMGIGVYGPALDQHGNSSAGLEALRRLSEELDLRVL
jgi:glutaminase